MFRCYSEIIKDPTLGHFEPESPMTAYVVERVVLGDTGDDFLIDGGGSKSTYRFGRRVLQLTDQGLILLFKFDTVAEAEEWMQWARTDEAERWVQAHGNWVD